jgi:hypothetical protein
MAVTASQIVSAGPVLNKVKEMLGRLDSFRSRGGSAIFPGREEKGEFALELKAEAVATASQADAKLRFLVAIGASYMFGDRVCHSIKCYDAFVREHIDYTAPSQFHRIRFQEGDVSDTYESFAT